MSDVDPDAELGPRAERGDRSAFELLVRRHAYRLYGVVLRVLDDRSEAEEVTQEAFIRAWRGIGRFSGRPVLHVAVPHRDQRGQPPHRSPTRRRLGLVTRPTPRRAGRPRRSPQRRAERDDLRDALQRAAEHPSPLPRPPVLRDIEGLSTAEAAAIMGLGQAAFKSRLHRARLSVREAIDDYLLEDDG